MDSKNPLFSLFQEIEKYLEENEEGLNRFNLLKIDYLESIVYELQIAKNIVELDHIYQEMEDNNLFSRRTPVKQGTKAFQVKNKQKRCCIVFLFVFDMV